MSTVKVWLYCTTQPWILLECVLFTLMVIRLIHTLNKRLANRSFSCKFSFPFESDSFSKFQMHCECSNSRIITLLKIVNLGHAILFVCFWEWPRSKHQPLVQLSSHCAEADQLSCHCSNLIRAFASKFNYLLYYFSVASCIVVCILQFQWIHGLDFKQRL